MYACPSSNRPARRLQCNVWRWIVRYSPTKPPIMINVQIVRSTTFCFFFWFSISCAVSTTASALVTGPRAATAADTCCDVGLRISLTIPTGSACWVGTVGLGWAADTGTGARTGFLSEVSGEGTELLTPLVRGGAATDGTDASSGSDVVVVFVGASSSSGCASAGAGCAAARSSWGASSIVLAITRGESDGVPVLGESEEFSRRWALASAFCCCFRSVRACFAAFFKADLESWVGSATLLWSSRNKLGDDAQPGGNTTRTRIEVRTPPPQCLHQIRCPMKRSYFWTRMPNEQRP